MPTAERGQQSHYADERKHILNVCKTHRAGFWVLFMLFTLVRVRLKLPQTKMGRCAFERNRIILAFSKDRLRRSFRPYQSRIASVSHRGGTGYIFTSR